MPAVSYALLVNDAPASPELMAAVEQIEVEDHADLADMLRLRVASGVRPDGSGWTLVDDDIFARLVNLKLRVTVGSGPPETLIEAHVIESESDFSNEPGESAFDVVAMDPTVLMNLEEKVRPWPNMTDSDIAEVVFGEYGFDTDLEPSQPAHSEVDYTPI